MRGCCVVVVGSGSELSDEVVEFDSERVHSECDVRDSGGYSEGRQSR